jgi:hypothetical protein
VIVRKKLFPFVTRTELWSELTALESNDQIVGLALWCGAQCANWRGRALEWIYVAVTTVFTCALWFVPFPQRKMFRHPDGSIIPIWCLHWAWLLVAFVPAVAEETTSW